jgi:hypothetical protein
VLLGSGSGFPAVAWLTRGRRFIRHEINPVMLAALAVR